MAAKILMIIAPDQFRDEELNVPRQILTERGFTVDTASTKTGVAQGMLGAKEDVILTVDQIHPAQYKAALVVGGMGSIEHLWENADVHQVVTEIAHEGGVVGAICLSGVVLARAGLLEGKKATVWETPESLLALKAGGATYTGEPCTVDGKIITANGPDAAKDFAESVAAVLAQQPVHP